MVNAKRSREEATDPASQEESSARADSEHGDGNEPRYKAFVAILTLLIGLFTFVLTLVNHQLDEHQRERAFETQLTAEIAVPASDVLATGEDLVGGALKLTTKGPELQIEESEYLRARKLWKRTSLSVSAKLSAYYEDDPVLNRHWQDFQKAVDSLLYLTTIGTDRPGEVATLRSYLNDDPAAKKLDALSQPPTGEDADVTAAYNEVSAAVSRHLELLTREIVDAHPNGFGNWVPLV